jgi:hypothetical protein
MTAQKPPNASAVSRLLVTAGLTKSVSMKSGMVRGWSEWSEGFRCSRSYDKTAVLIEWKFSSYDRTQNADVRDRKFAAITTALESKGYTVALEMDRYWPRLIVTRPSTED